MTCPLLNFTSINASSMCSGDQTFLLAEHPWLFAPKSLTPLLCLGRSDFCDEIQQKNCHFAASLMPYSVMFCVFNALNIINNALSFAVFRKQENGAALTQRIVVLLLKSLSLVEIFFHFFFLMFHIAEYCLFSSAMQFRGIGTSMFLCLTVNLLIVLQTTFHIARNWIIVMISTFRYEAVCRALKPVKVFTSVGRVHAIIVAIVILSFLISSPRFICYSCVACDRRDDVYSLDTLELRLSPSLYRDFKNVYLIGALLVFQTGGPIITVCVFSCCIMLGLQRHKRLKEALKKQTGQHQQPIQQSHRHSLPQNQQSAGNQQQAASQQASRGNLLVIVLCVTFLVLEFPLFLSKILEGKISDSNLDAIVVHMSKFATLFDSFINIFIYSISNRRFRKDLGRLVRLNRLARIFCCCCRGRDEVPSTTEERVTLRTVNVPLASNTRGEQDDD